ncbi:hypothetical protein GA0070617_0737 [Micromonospora yangpuensis]|uniref:Uncharacterized protein n=1 Tax=Micromonospora yangpuensis TaxID=683228 RepID=A0A1C6U1M3_9ACTN|nr:hypothetical protein GA0070617_0737 [Micromonospora yangpuensis]
MSILNLQGMRPEAARQVPPALSSTVSVLCNCN